MCLQVGVAARAADTDNEGGELAQLMEALGEDERAAGRTCAAKKRQSHPRSALCTASPVANTSHATSTPSTFTPSNTVSHVVHASMHTKHANANLGQHTGANTSHHAFSTATSTHTSKCRR